jgi:hypothetical protein
MLKLTSQFVLQGMQNLANETEAQLLIPRRQQIYRALRMQVCNLNPDLPDSQWTRVTIEEKSSEALYKTILDHARDSFQGSKQSGDGSQEPRPKKSLGRGLADIGLIGDDIRLLELIVDFHGIGRVDIEGDDGVWITEGKWTDKGREAIKALEENKVVVRLISPGESLVEDTLSAASKPFVITGDYHISERIVDRLNSQGVLLGVNFDPRNVGDFLNRVEEAKTRLGERSNLFAFLTATEGVDECKRPLYLGLIDRGWTHNEICGDREHRGLMGGGKLNVLARSEPSR